MMTMKSTVLAALFLAVSTGAVGQLQLSLLAKSTAKRPVDETATASLIDSVYVMTADGYINEKQVWEYNDQHQLSVVWQYACHGQYGDEAIESKLTFKDELYYNADGLQVCDDTYTVHGQELVLTARNQVTACDGMVPITVVYSMLESGKLLPILKRDTKRHSDGLIYSYEIMMRQGQGWAHFMTGDVTYDARDLPVEEVLTSTQYGQLVVERLSYVYDQQGNLTCLTDCVGVDGMEYSSSVTNYENMYDDYNRLIQVREIPDVGEETINLFFWNNGATTALHIPPKKQMESATELDLMGRCIPSTSIRHGIRIVGGKKIIH